MPPKSEDPSGDKSEDSAVTSGRAKLDGVPKSKSSREKSSASSKSNRKTMDPETKRAMQNINALNLAHPLVYSDTYKPLTLKQLADRFKTRGSSSSSQTSPLE